jgi:hypothetical protein
MTRVNQGNVMAINVVVSTPWYRWLSRDQWRARFAFMVPLIAGTLIANFGGFGNAAVTVSFIYVVGFLAAIFLPETRGRPLSDAV